jgi:hypothetical protein
MELHAALRALSRGLEWSPYDLFIERSSARCAFRKRREGGAVSSRLRLQRLQARSRAVRKRAVGDPKASYADLTQ